MEGNVFSSKNSVISEESLVSVYISNIKLFSDSKVLHIAAVLIVQLQIQGTKVTYYIEYRRIQQLILDKNIASTLSTLLNLLLDSWQQYLIIISTWPFLCLRVLQIFWKPFLFDISLLKSFVFESSLFPEDFIFLIWLCILPFFKFLLHHLLLTFVSERSHQEFIV